METWFVEPRAKTNKTLACLFRVGYSSVKINKDFFVDRHRFFHKYIVINIIHALASEAFYFVTFLGAMLPTYL